MSTIEDFGWPFLNGQYVNSAWLKILQFNGFNYGTLLFSFSLSRRDEPCRVLQCCNCMVLYIALLFSPQKRMNQSEFREVSTELMTVMSQSENMEDLTHFTLSAQIVENLAKNIQDKREVSSHTDFRKHRKLSSITIICVFTPKFHVNCITYYMYIDIHNIHWIIILYISCLGL